MRLINLYFLFLTVLLLASGCAVNAVSSHSPVSRSWAEQEGGVSQLTSWQMRGRVAIKSVNQSFDPISANVFWRQVDQSYDIELFGPVGLGAIKLLGQPGETVLTDSQSHQYKATSPEKLMQQQLGWSLPVSQLYYWVRGLPAPTNSGEVDNQAQKRLDPEHRLLSLKQAG